jgi:hypothetical protein
VIENTFDREKFEESLDLKYPGWRKTEEKIPNDQEKNDWGLPKNHFRHVLNYLENSRVNINIRQVF